MLCLQTHAYSYIKSWKIYTEGCESRLVPGRKKLSGGRHMCQIYTGTWQSEEQKLSGDRQIK